MILRMATEWTPHGIFSETYPKLPTLLRVGVMLWTTTQRSAGI
jgi:hypothetical protein